MALRDFSNMATWELADEAMRNARALDETNSKVEGDLAAIVAELATRLQNLERRIDAL